MWRGTVPWEIRKGWRRRHQLSDDEFRKEMRLVAQDAPGDLSLRFFLIPRAIYGDSLWRVMKVEESRNSIFRSRSIYLFSFHARFSVQYSSRWVLKSLCRSWWRSEDLRQRLGNFSFKVVRTWQYLDLHASEFERSYSWLILTQRMLRSFLISWQTIKIMRYIFFFYLRHFLPM